MNEHDRDKWGEQWPGGGVWEPFAGGFTLRRAEELRDRAEQDQREAEEVARKAASPSRTAQDERTPVLPSVPPPPTAPRASESVSDEQGRKLLARWRRHR